PVVLLVDDLVDLPAVVASDDQGDHQDGHDETQAGAGKGAQDDESAADASGNLDGLGVLAHGGLALGNRVVSVGAEGHGVSSSIALLGSSGPGVRRLAGSPGCLGKVLTSGG